MLMGDELAGIWLGEEGDISTIMEVSNEFNYVTPSKCFFILMGDYTEGKRLIGKFSYRDIQTVTRNCFEIFPSPEPERFFGRKEKSVPYSPFPTPNA